jgi:hypothetical protein
VVVGSEGVSPVNVQRMGVEKGYCGATSAVSTLPLNNGRDQQGSFVSEGLWGQRAAISKQDEWGTGGGVLGLQVDHPCKQSRQTLPVLLVF